MRMATCHPDRQYKAHGLCVSCYQMSLKGRRRTFAECHPDRPHVAKGLCHTCYHRQWEQARTATRPEGYLKWKRCRQHGIDETAYNTMVAVQEGLCAICRMPLVLAGDRRGAPHIDHCHATGKVRGLLCVRCNLLLGYAKDSIECLQSAVEYLKAA